MPSLVVLAGEVDLRIPIKVEIQSDSSTANSLTDRLRAGPRTKHSDTLYFWAQERVQGGDLSKKKVAYSDNLRRCWNEASLCFNHGSRTPPQDVLTIGAVEELSISHDERTMTGEED